ncbi:hypothetical protein FIBSPDRAFT_131739 [Athelia psychrophila]|uniref:Ubiquitin-like domain-containing protein n=1 Tax=Athelia psychrophila TaxID=1759441 RepID=A0A166CDU8_9AGAM|nr:hypothetical protein FIBSPDRAFT_131739 [Fibularhizoctonia sp. CBS 109695]
MVNSVNGNLTMGDYISGDQVHIDYIEYAQINHFYHIIESDKIPRHLREMYTKRPPMDRGNINATAIRLADPSPGVVQPPDSRPSGPLTDYIDADVIIQAFYPSGTVDRSLIEIQVIADIMDALMENSSLRHSAKLPETLTSLQRILKLTKLALRAYQHTPLAQALSLAIIAEAEHCRQLLKKLLSSLANCRHALSAAMLHFIREYIWSRTSECVAFSDLDSKLRDCHGSFAACILALGSFASHEIEWGTGTVDLAVLHNFCLLFKQESTSLQHIRIDTVIVIDHMARHLPVPTVFCKSWQDFNVVITGFCKYSAGGMLIQRGAYRILSSDDEEFINPTDISTVLQPGMTLEMSIVLREPAAERYGGEEHRCPRCNHINSKVITVSRWVSCRNCNGQFEISPQNDSVVSPAASGLYHR